MITKLNSIKKGIIKGYNIQPLPDNLYSFYNNIFFRIFRVIGGISIILYLSKQYLLLPLLFQYFILALSLLQFIQIIIFSFLKTYYLIKKLIHNPEEFEVRNSPLDKYATHIAKIIACWKSACTVGVSGTSMIGTGMLVDSALEQAGHEKIFEPYFSWVINKIHPSKAIEAKKNFFNIREQLKEIKDVKQQADFLKNFVSDVKIDDLIEIGFKPEEANEFVSEVESLKTAKDTELSNLVSKSLELASKANWTK